MPTSLGRCTTWAWTDCDRYPAGSTEHYGADGRGRCCSGRDVALRKVERTGGMQAYPSHPRSKRSRTIHGGAAGGARGDGARAAAGRFSLGARAAGVGPWGARRHIPLSARWARGCCTRATGRAAGHLAQIRCRLVSPDRRTGLQLLASAAHPPANFFPLYPMIVRVTQHLLSLAARLLRQHGADRWHARLLAALWRGVRATLPVDTRPLRPAHSLYRRAPAGTLPLQFLLRRAFQRVALPRAGSGSLRGHRATGMGLGERSGALGGGVATAGAAAGCLRGAGIHARLVAHATPCAAGCILVGADAAGHHCLPGVLLAALRRSASLRQDVGGRMAARPSATGWRTDDAGSVAACRRMACRACL